MIFPSCEEEVDKILDRARGIFLYLIKVKGILNSFNKIIAFEEKHEEIMRKARKTI